MSNECLEFNLLIQIIYFLFFIDPTLIYLSLYMNLVLLFILGCTQRYVVYSLVF
jgi:hypothetical protein